MSAVADGTRALPGEPKPLDAQRDDLDADAEHELDDIDDSKPKKKRRVVKTPDKKYECPHPDCGKAYSRAEHLYRHQLNHTPKQIYHCDFPGCDRNFVRADLCARHKERHTAKGSHLQRKDAFLHSQRPVSNVSGATSPSGSATISASPVDVNHGFPPAPVAEGLMPTPGPVRHYPPGTEELESNSAPEFKPLNNHTAVPVDPQLGPYASYPGRFNEPQGSIPPLQPAPPDGRQYSFGTSFASRPAPQTLYYGRHQPTAVAPMQPPPISSPPMGGPIYAHQPYPSPTSTNQQFRSPTNFSALPSLPPFGFPQGYGPASSSRSGSMISPPTFGNLDQQPVPNSVANSISDFNMMDQMTSGYTMPVFGNDLYNRSPPSVMDENFLNILFNVNGVDLSDPSPPAPEPEPAIPSPLLSAPLPKVEPDGTKTDATVPTPSDGFDISIRESNISESKQYRLIDMLHKFPEIEHNHGRRAKAEILAGDTNDPNHVLSLQMLKTCLTSYWIHIHQQMPILHRPTFHPETCPDLLLLAMMCLGATCLERTHPQELIKTCTELAFFAAHHIRWEVFKDAEFRPTAKLWTFQSMLLLELFEKMYSTRALHERAHVHHATTLTVMRRGSSLIGRSTESSKDQDDPTRTPPGPDGSINTSGQNTPDAFWNRWITAEATRRAAFAAFVIDSTHATLFGHSAVMSPHELRLSLPCDEALWSAASSAEVQRVEASLAANGFKSTSFIEGLKKTLNGHKVRTNTFGRVILMAGLLNVSWHMNQRDLQVSSLGATSTLGNQIKWRAPLTRAFDFWRRDFDDSLAKNDHWLAACDPRTNPADPSSLAHRDSVFESRTCLHSLAHMAMHVDIIDCQVFAGAERALGRVVTPADRQAIQRRMREQWAPSARARDATFYALRFLCEVLIPEDEMHAHRPQRPHPLQPPSFRYSARDDYLLNRPWILFFAALIVWAYGYALDGPIRPSNYTLTTRENRIFDMQRYLMRMGGVGSPDDLEGVRDRNSCLGLLLLLRERFAQPRWELLHEASETLGSCIELLTPGHNGEVRM